LRYGTRPGSCTNTRITGRPSRADQTAKLRGEVIFKRPGELANDGKVIEDACSYR
jgi:hypothetical protein